MTSQNERLLTEGPLNCPFKNYANEPVCTPGCKNFDAISQAIRKYHEWRRKEGKPISVAQIVEQLQSGDLFFLTDDTMDLERAICKAQPKIPVLAIRTD